MDGSLVWIPSKFNNIVNNKCNSLSNIINHITDCPLWKISAASVKENYDQQGFRVTNDYKMQETHEY